MNHGIMAGGECCELLKKLIGEDKGKGPGITSCQDFLEQMVRVLTTWPGSKMTKLKTLRIAAPRGDKLQSMVTGNGNEMVSQTKERSEQAGHLGGSAS